MNKWEQVYIKVVLHLIKLRDRRSGKENITSICEILNIDSEGVVENLIYDCYMEIEYNEVNYVQTVSDCVNKIFKIKDLTRG
jgi:hypothetical protein